MSFQIGTATSVQDLLTKMDTFLKLGHSLDPAYTGTGTGTITLLIGTASTVLEIITVTLTSSTAFSVSGSVSGALGTGTVGTPFTCSVCGFTIVAGGVAWAAADAIVFTMTPPWVQQRAINIGTADEYIWKAPGNANANSIYVGVQRFLDVGGDYDNVRVGGFTGFNSGLTFANQAGAMIRPVMPALRVGSMPYWLMANGQRAILITKVSTVYECLYLGFLNSYANPNQHPYPLVVGASMAWSTEPGVGSASWRWSYVGNEHRAFPLGYFSVPGASGVAADNQCQIRLRRVDGVWRGFGNQSGSTVSTTANAYVWPSNNGNMSNVITNLDGSIPLFPVVLQEDLGYIGGSYPTVAGGLSWVGPQSYGELDGVTVCSGQANTAENTVTISRIQNLVVQNVYRNTKSDYFAVKLA
jgi:hypothetical protein